MAGSTSTPEPPPAPDERTVASLAEQAQGIDEVIDRARTLLRVFDVDLSQAGWNGAAGPSASPPSCSGAARASR
jgi:uncharacterized protein YbjT (DUF2867 family)